jgi:hypothetical protein
LLLTFIQTPITGAQPSDPSIYAKTSISDTWCVEGAISPLLTLFTWSLPKAEIWYRFTEGRNIPHAATRIKMAYSCDLTDYISWRE